MWADEPSRVIERVRQVDGDVMAVRPRATCCRMLPWRHALGGAPAGGGPGVAALSPGSISALGYEREVPVLRSWNGSRAEQPGPA